MTTLATDKQMDYVLILFDRIKRRDYTDSAFYQVTQRTIGRRNTNALTKAEASKLIEALKEELE